MGILHRVDMFIWVLKVYRVHFWTRASNFILRRTCVAGFVCVFVEFLWS